MVDVLLETIDTKRFYLWDPKDKEWHVPETYQSDIENVEHLFEDNDIWSPVKDWISDFVYDLPKPFVYQWLITEDGLSQTDDLIDNQPAGRVYDRHFKNRFSHSILLDWSVYDLASSAMKIYIFNEIVNLFEEHYDFISKHFGEKNWYESEAYDQTADFTHPTCLADVGMSQKDFI